MNGGTKVERLVQTTAFDVKRIGMPVAPMP
jgi:hypothetical protein